ncbi:hypothetical protein GMSM_33090 [Geomonas sp. Red276]
MGDSLTRKQTVYAALVDAKRKAVEYFATQIKSETEVKDFEVRKDSVSSYANADVKVVKELGGKWYSDAQSGDCYSVRIKAEVTSRPIDNSRQSHQRDSGHSGFTQWLTSSEYQAKFNQLFKLKMYPAVVEGRSSAGVSMFRAVFKPFPNPEFAFWSHHGINREFFENKNGLLLGNGFTLKSLQTFVDKTGIERYQATWVKDEN